VKIPDRVIRHAKKVHQAVKKAVSMPTRKLDVECPDVDVSIEGSRSQQSAKSLTQFLNRENNGGDNGSVSENVESNRSPVRKKEAGPQPA